MTHDIDRNAQLSADTRRPYEAPKLLVLDASNTNT